MVASHRMTGRGRRLTRGGLSFSRDAGPASWVGVLLWAHGEVWVGRPAPAPLLSAASLAQRERR